MLPTSSKRFIKNVTSLHIQKDKPNIFIFTTPRSGSTWIMELLATQDNLKYVSEPFDLRDRDIRRILKVKDWEELHSIKAEDKILAYIDFYVSGAFGSNFRSAPPFTSLHKWVTNRIVFKVLLGSENHTDILQKEYNCHIIYLLRHPIAVSLSRKETPRVKSYLNSDYAAHFDQEEIDYGWDIINKGNDFEIKVLDWCLQNAVLLKNMRENWIFLTYEEMVIHPEKVVKLLKEKLELTNDSKMYERLYKPSGTTYKSDTETRQKFAESNKALSKEWLISKWKSKVNSKDEKRAFEIIQKFGINVYEYGKLMPRTPDTTWAKNTH
jgi:hypothetical protein